MAVCNACRYCEGLCAVFPAMELRRDFSGGELDYLASLCHGCILIWLTLYWRVIQSLDGHPADDAQP
jgi:MinD superfamily P-loop ATPase